MQLSGTAFNRDQCHDQSLRVAHRNLVAELLSLQSHFGPRMSRITRMSHSVFICAIREIRV